jgi:hypothetical protein
MRNVSDKSCTKNEYTFYVQSLLSENRTVYEIIPKNIVETERPQMTSQYGAYTLRAGLARLYAHMSMHSPTISGTHMHARTNAQACTHGPICNNYRFSTATMVSWTRLNVTQYVHCLSCLNSWWWRAEWDEILSEFTVSYRNLHFGLT